MRIDSHIPARSNLIRILALYFFAVSGLQAGGVYWTDRGLSLLKRMQFDGSGLETIALSGAIQSPGTNLRGIAVDPSNHHLYWADNGSDRLFVANMDGSSSAVLVSIAGGDAFPADIRLNLPANHLYWCDQLRNRIQRSSLEGLNVVDVIQNAAPSGPYSVSYTHLTLPTSP
jgi:DNA-binding beta-propeller fold protein YncE